MIQITDKPISPEKVVEATKTTDSGCVVTYVGLIRDNSYDKAVQSVEYTDTDGQAETRLQELADEIMQKWPVNKVSICHRVGRLEVGDINLVVAIAAGHRQEGLAAVAYAIDKFKEKLPTAKKETYTDGSILTKD